MKKYFFIPILLVLLILAAYEVLILYDNEFPFGRMWETPAVKPHEEALLVMHDGVVPANGGEAFFRVTVGKDLKFPFQIDDPIIVEQGQTLYGTFCAQCHGKYHDGNGTVGQSFYPLPTDLRNAKVQSMADGALFKEISYGLPNGRQPPLATTIETTDRWRIIAYVKSLGIRN